MPLQTHHHIASVKGLSSVTTLIVGSTQCALIVIDPPLLIDDAKSVNTFVKAHTSLPLAATPTPTAKIYAVPYVRAGIDREYDEKIEYWPTVFGKEKVSAKPTKPEVFPYSFFLLKGDEGSPVFLLGPVQGDSGDHTLFWLPTERTIVTGDAVYARSTHAWVEEIETADILHAWYLTLDLIEALQPTKIIAGHIEEGWELDAKEDMAYMRKYLDLFGEKITNAPKKASVEELYETFKNAFPQCEKNLDFFLGHLSNQFGEGGKVWEENRHHDVGGGRGSNWRGSYLGWGNR